MAMQAQASFKNGSSEIKVSLAVFSFKEGDIYAIYSPELDLFGYGKSEVEAKESFKINLDETLSYATTKGTLERELKRLGWKISKKEDGITFKVPDLDRLLKDYEHFKELFIGKDFLKFKEEVSIPIPA